MRALIVIMTLLAGCAADEPSDNEFVTELGIQVRDESGKLALSSLQIDRLFFEVRDCTQIFRDPQFMEIVVVNGPVREPVDYSEPRCETCEFDLWAVNVSADSGSEGIERGLRHGMIHYLVDRRDDSLDRYHMLADYYTCVP